MAKNFRLWAVAVIDAFHGSTRQIAATAGPTRVYEGCRKRSGRISDYLRVIHQGDFAGI